MRRLVRTISTFARLVPLAGLALLVSCDDDGPPKYYVGALDAASPIDAGDSPDATPSSAVDSASTDAPAQDLPVVVCDAPAISGSDLFSVVRYVSSLEQRLLVTTSNAIVALTLRPDGCPGERIASFGTDGRFETSALAACPLPDGAFLTASQSGVTLRNEAGDSIATCSSGQASMTARIIEGRSDGTAVAAFAGSPLQVLTRPAGPDASCVASDTFLSPEPFAVFAVARSHAENGFVVAEQAMATAPVVIARYDARGQRQAVSSSVLCSAVGIVETATRIAVADSTCQQVIVFDPSSLAVTGKAKLDGIPRGIAKAGGASGAIVPVAQEDQGSVKVSFRLVSF